MEIKTLLSRRKIQYPEFLSCLSVRTHTSRCTGTSGRVLPFCDQKERPDGPS